MKTIPISLEPVFHILGMLLSVLGGAMLIPAIVDGLAGQPNWMAFVGSSVLTLTVSGGMILATAGSIERFTVKQTFLLTTLSWVILAFFGSIPFMLSVLALSPIDALFESMSGLTTTGATVITGLDQLSSGLLLWRVLLHWYGGIGIIVMAIAILPTLGVGGMQLFRTESSDRGDKLFATVHEMAGSITLIYLGLTVLSMIMFRIAGMNDFDALCHAMSSIASGGFSNHDASFGYFDSKFILWVAIFSMILAALPLTYYIRLLYNVRTTIFSDTQVLTLIGVIVMMVSVMTTWRMIFHTLPWEEALTHSAFNVTSIITGTGFSSDDYGQWGTFPLVFFFILFFVGGCTGSTTGSIKIFRWQILLQALVIQIRRMLQPHRVVVLAYHGKKVTQDVIQSVTNLVVAMLLCVSIVAVTFSLLGLDLITSVSAAAAAITNVGPGLGPSIGPAGNYMSLPDAAKGVMVLVMVMGRLEIFTVLVLLVPECWRD